MKWVIGNWKSHKTIQEAIEWVEEIGPHLEKHPGIEVAVCPNYLALPDIRKAVQVGNWPILVGSQDVSAFEIGAFTGDVAATYLKPLVDLSIVGHSERRNLFKETDELIEKKVQRLLVEGITPVVCVQDDQTPIPEGCQIVAYEPVFAIGSGQPDTPQNANEVAKSIKQKHGSELVVLYGGSVKSDNAKAFVEQSDIDGLLIGGASLEVEEFNKIIEAVKSVS